MQLPPPRLASAHMQTPVRFSVSTLENEWPGKHRAVSDSVPSGRHKSSERSSAARFMQVAFDSSLGNDISSLTDDPVSARSSDVRKSDVSNSKTRHELHKSGWRWAYTPRSLMAFVIILFSLLSVLGIFLALYTHSSGTPLQRNNEASQTSLKNSDPTGKSTPSERKSGNQSDIHGLHKGSTSIVVYVSGAVAHAGNVTVQADSRVADAIEAAGGLKNNAQQTSINLAAKLSDGQHVHVFAQGESLVNVAGADAGSSHESADARQNQDQTAQADLSAKVNLNSATQQQLETLPNIGPVTAQKILQWRSRNGKFTDINQLKEVPGIGEKTFEQMKSQVTV